MTIFIKKIDLCHFSKSCFLVTTYNVYSLVSHVRNIFWRCSYKNRFINRVQNQSRPEVNWYVVNIIFLFSKRPGLNNIIFKIDSFIFWHSYDHLGLYRPSWQPKNVSLLWEKTVAWSWRPSATKSVRRNVKSKTKKFVWPFPIKSVEKRLNNYARTYLAQNAKR